MKLGLIILLGSYKFHRLFPLSQYDLPTHSTNILSFPPIPPKSQDTSGVSPGSQAPLHNGNTASKGKIGKHAERLMSLEQVALNPEVDYTRYSAFPLRLPNPPNQAHLFPSDQTSYLSYSRTSESSPPKRSANTWLLCLLVDRFVPAHPIVLLQILSVR